MPNSLMMRKNVTLNRQGSLKVSAKGFRKGRTKKRERSGKICEQGLGLITQ
jgi:hypothetical protein